MNDRNDSYGLSKFCSKIYKCQANMINILHQKLKEDEFRLLVQPEFVRSLEISNTFIKRSNGSYFDGEDFVEAVPNAILIELFGISTSVNTFPNLSKLPGKNQLIRFCYRPGKEDLYNFHSKFDVEKFKVFVTKNAAPKATFIIQLGATQRELHDTDTRKINCLLRSWVPKEHTPIILLANRRDA
uniref:Uncharacterized protein n=1 Tax=Panagrolaimus sp. PS1159 TaxID=55785 RepID=A0AC35FFH8_9BILA